jgi:hypothetical protein
MHQSATALKQNPYYLPFKYDSLTQLWGPTNKTETIILNGTPFPASEPIAAALYRLRPPSGPPRNLWMDAVCVSRQEQRHLLQPIYTEVCQLGVWMGAGLPGFPCPEWDM